MMYCTKCGKPLPENGVCSCTARREAAFLNALRSLPALWRAYFRNPVALTRRMGERRDWLRGLVVLLATLLASLLSTLVFALRFSGGFALAFAPWVTAGLFAPVLAVALCAGVLYALTSLAKMRVDFRTVAAVLGVNAMLPLTLTAASVLLTLIHPLAFHILSYLALAAWGVSFFAAVYEVFSLRVDRVNLLVLTGGLAAAYAIVILLRGWLVSTVL